MSDAKRDDDAGVPLSGRDAAHEAVLAALRGRGFVNETLGRLRAGGRLAGRESGLAAEIAFGAVRHALTIEHVFGQVARFDQRRVKPELRAVLLAAGYQIIWMDRVPVFAAVDEAVELTRRRVSRRATGMVNAILRGLTRAIADRRTEWRTGDPAQVRVSWDRACEFKTSVLPDPEKAGRAAYVAAATGERPARYRALVERFGAERAEQVAWAEQAVPAIALHRNTLRVNEAVFQARVRAEYGDAIEWLPDVTFLPSSVNVADAPLFQEGRAYVQDVTAHFAAELVAARRGERVLDFCAAPGGKSIAMAQQIGDLGEIVACDASPDRILRVRENARRMRLTSIRTHLIQTSDASESDLNREFDAALVDVPCSNSGVIARRPEARLGLTGEKLASLTALQAALLRRAAASVRPGGRLIYSTCSIEPDENEQVVEAFLAENTEWRLDCARTTLPAWGPRLAEWRDGGFVARLLREPRV